MALPKALIALALPYIIILSPTILFFFLPQTFRPEQESTVFSNLFDYLRTKDTLKSQYYSQREILHLSDVRDLLMWGVRVWVVLSVLTSIALVKYKKVGLDSLRMGSLITLILTILICVCALLNFDIVFILLHKIFFRNDYWLLPQNSVLINIFPQTYFVVLFRNLMLYYFVISVLIFLLSIKLEKYVAERT